MKKRAISLLLCCACLLCLLTVEAADVEMVNDRIAITVAVNPGEVCLVTVVSADYQTADLKKETPENLYYQGEFLAGTDGGCKISFCMGKQARTGDYLIRVRPKSGAVQEFPFYYYSIEEKQEIIDQINRSGRAEAEALLAKNRTLLGLTLGENTAIDEKRVFSRMADVVVNGGSFTLDTLLQCYQESVVLEAFAQSDTAFLLSDGKLSQDAITGFPAVDGYALYREGMNVQGVEAVHKALFGVRFADIRSLQSAFCQQTILQGLLHYQKSGYGHVKEIVQTYRKVLEEAFAISFTDYDALISQDAFHRNLLSRQFSTPAELRTAFEGLAKTLRQQQGTGGGSGGKGTSSGGSGGGSSSGDFALYPSETPSDTNLPAQAQQFDDIDEVPWAADSITALASRGIINGKAERIFAPHDSVTREEFIKMIVLAFGFEAEKAADMPDVDVYAWYAPYVAAAVEAGIVNGYEDGSFGVGRQITRQEMAVIAYRAGMKIGKPLSANADGHFADDAEISAYAKASVYAMEQSGILNGIGNNLFAPTQLCTRAQAAKVVALLLAL